MRVPGRERTRYRREGRTWKPERREKEGEARLAMPVSEKDGGTKR